MAAIKYFGTNYVNSDLPIIPIDSYIDIQFEKAVLPGLVAAKIGDFADTAAGYEDIVPPASGVQRVTHRYKIKQIEIEIDHNGWKPYHPYEAIVPAERKAEVTNFKIGYWQKTDRFRNKIRLLALSPVFLYPIGTTRVVPARTMGPDAYYALLPG